MHCLPWSRSSSRRNVNKKLTLSAPELEHLKVTMEGCIEELEELMSTHDYYVTELTDRLATCLEILGRAK